MKVGELRIGNYVHQGDGFVMQIVAIFSDVVYLNFEGNEGDVLECKIKDLKGFEFNTEWFEDLGFKQSEDKKWWYNDDFSYSKEEKWWYWGYKFIPLELTKYVHLIQNLHQSLTGKELLWIH